MRSVSEQEIGLMFWTTGNPEQDLARVFGFGLSAGQLGFPGELPLQKSAESWASALAKHPEFVITTAICSYVGESYSDVETVRQTVGLVPQNTRAERVARTKAVADIAASLGIGSVGCHIGFVPDDRQSPEYKQVCSLVRDFCDHLGEHHQNFTLETGQERAEALLAFIDDVGSVNLKINFDPANMILYGMGDPVRALRTVGSRVVSVHCKDGLRPAASGSLGIEQRLGSGEVDYPAFLDALRQIGYKGILSIEREEPDVERREADIRHAVTFLRDLLKS
ncbi:MAG: sugar phosphate isomerase/epimerase family protein [Bryobacteraceae bacterium]